MSVLSKRERDTHTHRESEYDVIMCLRELCSKECMRACCEWVCADAVVE